MKNLRNTVVAILVVLLVSSCQNRQEVIELQQATEAVHDAAMKDMAEMNRLGRALKKELAALDSAQTTGARRDSMVAVLADITKAEADMMAWMTQYKAPDDLPADKAKAYLEEQKKAIDQNLKDIQQALETAKQIH